ncbi:hypothetical protein [Maribacter sp. 2304DJ31-5]|uniref:hypothetical protein n=1 Tax=Maribacter sp. 2304DJ31-5 TaxID=3386273 RepID=UPI0039BCD527
MIDLDKNCPVLKTDNFEAYVRDRGIVGALFRSPSEAEAIEKSDYRKPDRTKSGETPV